MSVSHFQSPNSGSYRPRRRRNAIALKDRMRAVLWVLQGKPFIFAEPKTFIVSNNVVGTSNAQYGIRVMDPTGTLPRIG